MNRTRPWIRGMSCVAAVLAVIAAAVTSGAIAQAEPIVQVRYDPHLGAYLTGPNGMTLYTFERDEENVSNCYGTCEQNWPPLLAGKEGAVAPLGLPGKLGTTQRRDGSRHVTYNGRPLYYWVGDSEPGQTSGQGVGGNWYVANVAPTVLAREHPDLGSILVAANGFTLYRFIRDTMGESTCYGSCAQNWPPLLVSHLPSAPEGLPGELGVTQRTNGTLQVTYEGMPLYFWAADQAPGDTTGQGVGDVWFVVNP
ncbi:hypothetical protein [Limnochorda pilosa]|uniref:hypothetical protein n=1 Tax=Limnochorda pilosa TaxID=1555112 RepID=UPI0018E09CB8|nr:hypothetical protein [Limnochorda pilosa]